MRFSKSRIGLSIVAISAGIALIVPLLFLKGDGEGGSMVSLRSVLKGSNSSVLSLAFGPEGKYLAAGQEDGTVKLWELPSGAEWASATRSEVCKFPFHLSVSSLSFSPKKNTLAWGGGNPVVSLFDIKERKLIGNLEEPAGAVERVLFSPDGQWLATATAMKSGIVRLWNIDARTNRILFDESKSEVGVQQAPWIGGFAFHPNSKILAVGLFGKVVLLDVATGDDLRVIQGREKLIKSLVFTPDGKTLVGTNAGLSFWNFDSGEETYRLRGMDLSAWALAPGGDQLALGLGSTTNQPSYVQIWDIPSRREVVKFLCHSAALTDVAWSSDGVTLATSSTDKSVKLWRLALAEDENRK